MLDYNNLYKYFFDDLIMKRLLKWLLPFVATGAILWPNSSVAETPMQEEEGLKPSYYLLTHGGNDGDPVSWVKFSSSGRVSDFLDLEFKGEYFDADRNVYTGSSEGDGLALKLNLIENFSSSFGGVNTFVKFGLGLQGSGNGFEGIKFRSPYEYGLEHQILDNLFFYFQNSGDVQTSNEKLEVGVKYKF